MHPIDAPLPAVRPLEATPTASEPGDGETQFVLRDASLVSEHMFTLSLPAYFVVAHLDGRRSIADIQAAFASQFGLPLKAEQIAGLVETLDEALMLQTSRFEAAYAAQLAAYRSGPRDNRDRWPSESALREEIEAVLTLEPPAPADERASEHGADLRGLIAPHLDYERGAPCYAAAYRQLKDGRLAERYVILGTNHFGRSVGAAATRQDFLTPLGLVKTDRAFVAALEERLGRDLCGFEMDHLREHSVELQVQVLQVLHGETPFEIVPILCPDVCGPDGADGPSEAVSATALAEALRSVLGDDDRRTMVIAGADLSHVGRHFGDPAPSTPTMLGDVSESDQRLLGLLRARREKDFVATLRATENATRVCSAGCIYTLLRALPDGACDVLHYHQAVDFAAETHVTCAAAVVR